MKRVAKTQTTNQTGGSFTQGSLAKAMMAFALPYMLGIIVQNLYGAVDLFVVGRFAATADVSAVTVGSQLMTTATQLIIGFAAAITILVGRHYGAKDEERLSAVTGTSVVLFGAAACVITVAFLLLHQPLVALMQTPGEAVAQTRQYVLGCAPGILFIVGYNVISSIMTGLGDAKRPFLFIVVACLINVGLDLLLVCGFGMGALGAAIATSAAQMGSFLFAFLYLRRKGLGYPLSRAHIKVDRQEAKQIVRIGAPVAIQNSLISLSFLFITAVINKIGLLASAASGVVEKLITFLFVPASAMGTAVATASSQNIGAGQEKRSFQAMGYGIIMSLIPSVIICILSQFFGEAMASLLTKDPQVVTLAAGYLRSYVVDIIMVSFVFSINGYLNSINRSWFSMLHSLVTTFFVRVPVAYVLGSLADTSLFLIGWASPLSTFVSLIICTVYLAALRRRQRLNPAF